MLLHALLLSSTLAFAAAPASRAAADLAPVTAPAPLSAPAPAAVAAPAAPHALGEDYVFLSFNETSIEGHFEIHFEELRDALGLELREGEEALADVQATADIVQAYVEANFSIAPEGGAPYAFTWTRQDVQAGLAKGSFAQYFFEIPLEALPGRIDFVHSMFYEYDKLHRGLLIVEFNAKTNETYPDEYTSLVFSPGNGEQTLDLQAVPSIMGPWDMIPQGVLHIWIGIDHILFLLALMLPTVLMRRSDDEDFVPVEGFRTALLNLLKIVTVFTIAHSSTLLLAALGLVEIPSRLVESIIALSIILVALNNISGKVKHGSLWIILGLGLFHGLGFASVMGHLPFRMGQLLKIVVGFNIGVELGQLAIVVAVFPVLFFLRKSAIYQPVFLKGFSAVLGLVAAWWFVQRAFGLE